MRGDKKRLELIIDVLDQKDQRALAESDLRPTDLIGAILEEFREEFRAREYLSYAPVDYQLLNAKAEGNSPLDDELPIGLQVDNKGRLLLAEAELPLPDGAQRPTKQTYLREEATGKVYKLHWHPAIIGRPAEGYDDNEWVAVNLADHKQGQRVSRRHAQITEEGGRHYIESLSPQNRTMIQDNRGTQTPVDSDKHLLKQGDIIYLEQSRIALKFIVREEVGAR